MSKSHTMDCGCEVLVDISIVTCYCGPDNYCYCYDYSGDIRDCEITYCDKHCGNS